MKQSVIVLLLFSAMTLGAQGLRVIAAAGNEATGNGIILCFTVGEIAIAQRTAPNNTRVNEGFWQSGINCGIVAVVDISGVQADVKVLPNPTTGHFTLDLGEGFPVELTCTLFDPLGRAAQTATVATGQTQIAMGDPGLENGLYLLQLQTADGRTAHTFRVIKM